MAAKSGADASPTTTAIAVIGNALPTFNASVYATASTADCAPGMTEFALDDKRIVAAQKEFYKWCSSDSTLQKIPTHYREAQYLMMQQPGRISQVVDLLKQPQIKNPLASPKAKGTSQVDFTVNWSACEKFLQVPWISKCRVGMAVDGGSFVGCLVLSEDQSIPEWLVLHNWSHLG